MTAVDWAGLHRAAQAACARAYAPYSTFPVGAAALVDDGRIVAGCNVENASYGIGLCAECGLVSALVAGGGGRLVALACVDATGGPLMPCGRCRQLLWEHAAEDMLVDSSDGPIPMADLLPRAFGRSDLDRVAAAGAGSTDARHEQGQAPIGRDPRNPDPRDTAALYRAVASPSPDTFDPEDLR
ncbi:cytidine deaminase [Raineyella antarctica]|uniref:Cytidine deaminase n=1 Tax=Raineyella antarctica TaxID=1577474 RepID=A0A1G6H4K1_9ACTN|nr:cytidine deaminase [Raineyella antarctica]